jgi:hypothetical protein
MEESKTVTDGEEATQANRPDDRQPDPGGTGEPAPARLEVVSAIQIVEYTLKKEDPNRA